jgi:hypothetical protein
MTEKNGTGASVGAPEVKRAEPELDFNLPTPPAPGDMPVLTSSELRDIDEVVTRLEKSIASYKRLKVVALKLTDESDWVSVNKKPYLTETGCHKIAPAFGVHLTKPEIKSEYHEDKNGRYLVYIASGQAFSRVLNVWISDIGTCSQRDKFFAKETDPVTGKKVWKELADIDLTDIIKKAVSNLNGRLIRKLLGMVGLSWEDLKAAGLDTSKITQVEFKTKSAAGQEAAAKPNGGSQPKPKAEPRAYSDDDIAVLKDELSSMLSEMSGGDKAMAEQMLKTFSSYTDKDGKPRFARSLDISPAWLHRLAPIIRTAHAQWLESNKGGGR